MLTLDDISDPRIFMFGLDDTDSVTRLENLLSVTETFWSFKTIGYYILLGLPVMVNAIQTASYVFAASPIAFRCNINMCDNITEPVMKYTQVQSPECNGLIFDPIKQRRYHLLIFTCYTDIDPKVLALCVDGGIVRNEEYTAANELGLVCSDGWNPAIANIVHKIGLAIGLILGSVLADIYGRRPILLLAGYLSCIVGCVQSYSRHYAMFLTLELLKAVCASSFYPVAFVLAIESVVKERRVVAGVIITVFYCLGEVLLALLAALFENWKTLLIAANVVAGFQMYALTSIYESIRWQLACGNHNAVSKALKKIFAANYRDFDRDLLTNLTMSNQLKFERAGEGRYPIWYAIKSLRYKILIFSVYWVALCFGLSMHIVDIGSNKYENFCIYSFMQASAAILTLFVLKKIPRRLLLMSCLCFSIVSTIALEINRQLFEMVLLVPHEFVIISGFQVLFLWAAETFPTNVRSTLLALSISLGQFILTLNYPTMGVRQLYEYLPIMLYGIYAIVCVICLKFQRDNTDDIVLPLIVHDVLQRET